jgi:hypothetical protein
MKWIQIIRNWSEVWALLIPLIVIVIYKPKAPDIRPLVLYVITAFILNFTATFIVEYYYYLPTGLQNNNLLYNLHSIARVVFFSWYILKITPPKLLFIYKAILSVYVIFILVDFLFFESPIFISPSLYSAGSFVLLFLCLTFFLRSMQDESGTNWISQPSFLVCTGISLYEAITFFIFLFIYPVAEKNPDFGRLSFKIYQAIFIVFCVLLALALYRSKKQEAIANTI